MNKYLSMKVFLFILSYRGPNAEHQNYNEIYSIAHTPSLSLY